ncbi:hypothetical protein AVEN_86460-1 [Araneus ventricosus]|uniref:Uncharacterized protein n=1 Tax=Araneus ventricosus TaxID=182803 RepID=A0A4Y2VYQ7_ARAVE|nr:hypothetical protein AVEN_86460-1 [Araneus ventricosus]
MGVLQLISNIKDQRQREAHTQLNAQFLPFSSQLGSSAMPSSSTMYHTFPHQIHAPANQYYQHFGQQSVPSVVLNPPSESPSPVQLTNSFN